MNKYSIALLALAIAAEPVSEACTNLIVGKKASSDGSTFISYNMDMYGKIWKFEPTAGGFHSPGETVKLYDYDNAILLGEIPQTDHTWSEIGYINEKQLMIMETTWGGRSGQANPDGLFHYTSLIRVALQRSATAREAIATMGDLVAEYGYASTGETFSIADKDEIWVMEMIGKGADEKGAVWVAVRIPEDCICAHANQSRIHRFDQKDKDNVICSKDVISYARKKGFFTGKDNEFDFSKAYSPTNFHMQRACEARVWSIFNRFSADAAGYIECVDGFHLDKADQLPLYIKPDRKISLEDAMNAMRDHYEGTPFDMTTDITGGPWHSPYRPRPQEFTVDGQEYFHERPIGSQQAACCFVGQNRDWLPDHIGGVLWFGNDDPTAIAYTPLYCHATRVPRCYADPEATDVDFSWDSAFWVCNWVANMAYPYWSVLSPALISTRDDCQRRYIEGAAEIEAKAGELPEDQAVKALTKYSEDCASDMMTRWKDLGVRMIVMFNDMALKPEKDGKFLKDDHGRGVSTIRNGYPEMYNRTIADETGNRYKSPSQQ